MIKHIDTITQFLLLFAWCVIVSFSYSNSSTSDNIFHLVGNFFWTNFVSLVPKSYSLHYILHNKIAVLEFSYKTISIVYSLDNIYKCDCTEILWVISWLDITELLFYLGRTTIIIFVMRCSCLWVSWLGSNIKA